MRNKIINSTFLVWQRGITFTEDGYTADRWRKESFGTSSIVTREYFELGQTDVPGNPKRYASIQVNSALEANNYAKFEQRLEGVRTFSGEIVTLSFWAKADSEKYLSVELVQNFGMDLSKEPSPSVSGIGVKKISLTNKWQYYTITIQVPSIYGKKIGYGNHDYLSINFWFDAGSNFDYRTNKLGHQTGVFDIALVQIERGNEATPFEDKLVGEELSLCQRFFERTFYLYRISGDFNNSFLHSGSVPYRTKKRMGSPTIALVADYSHNFSNILIESANSQRCIISGIGNPGHIDRIINVILHIDVEL